ncbi:hypothetical protein [Longispora albida]|uniref:hypothetical protein n=1 Tax=Longispora albida TaxID=203523 RepID=UPI00035EFF39|nr:hypothetical protein [Longispora albida]
MGGLTIATFEQQQPSGRARASFINAVTAEVTRLGNVHEAPWTAFTPVLVAAPTAPTLGTGATVTGRYRQAGSILHAEIHIVFGSSGVNAGSGSYVLLLPRPVAAGVRAVGSLFLSRSGGGTVQAGVCRVSAGQLELIAATARVTHAVPWAWAAGDTIAATIAYQPA